METLKDIANVLGGSVAFGAILGEKMTTTYQYIRNGFVPTRHWRTVIHALKENRRPISQVRFMDMMLDAEKRFRESQKVGNENG